jgi:hypothetical protein
MTTYFCLKLTHVNITHNSFGHNWTPCHVELLKQVVRHDSNDHSHLIQYDYKSNCKHSCFCLVLLVHYTFFNNGDCMGYKNFYVKFKILIVYVHEVLQLFKIVRHL